MITKIFQKIRKVSGETLVEALISLTILGITGAVASALIIASVQNTISSSKYLIAQSLAVEGVEAVKNVVYTNIMLHPEDEEWWFNSQPMGNEPISENTFYKPKQTIPAQSTQAISWELDATSTGGLTCSGSCDPTSINLISTPTVSLCQDQENGGYKDCVQPMDPDTNPFYRAIYVECVDGFSAKNPPPCAVGELLLFVRVQWREGGKVNVFDMKDVKISIE